MDMRKVYEKSYEIISFVKISKTKADADDLCLSMYPEFLSTMKQFGSYRELPKGDHDVRQTH